MPNAPPTQPIDHSNQQERPLSRRQYAFRRENEISQIVGPLSQWFWTATDSVVTDVCSVDDTLIRSSGTAAGERVGEKKAESISSSSIK